MSVAVIPMAEELGWSALDRGLVNSAFFWGYSLTQIPAGWVSTKCDNLLPQVTLSLPLPSRYIVDTVTPAQLSIEWTNQHARGT